MSIKNSVNRSRSKVSSFKTKPIIEINMEDKRKLGFQIGLDIDKETDQGKYGWVIDLMIESVLPAGWERERDIDKQLVFYNRIDN
jgi:hypothetical protein